MDWEEDISNQAEQTEKERNTLLRRTEHLFSVTDQLLARVEEVLETTAPKSGSELKNLAGTLKNIKEIWMIRSGMDDKEQQLKLQNMERQIGALAEERALLVTLEDIPEEWTR